MVNDLIFPQDRGTGLTTGIDWDDAARFAQLAHLPGFDFVMDGMEFNANFTTNTLNITPGVARVSQSSTQTIDHSDEGGPPAQTILGATFVVQADASGDLTLTDGTVNHVWMDVDQTTPDRVSYRVNADNSPPSDEPFLKLGTVDTDTETVHVTNRSPELRLRRLVIADD